MALRISAYVAPDQALELAARLEAIPGVRHVVTGGRTSTGLSEITGDVEQGGAAPLVIDVMREFQLGEEDVTWWRTSTAGVLRRSNSGARLTSKQPLWGGVLARAREHSHTALLYVMYMVAAGVIAGVGVITGSSILIVGAMALAPDLLPITASAVGIVERRWRLTRRAEATLLIGLSVASAMAAATTLLLRALGRVDKGLSLAETSLGLSFTHVGAGAVVVALAAGMAGMLAYETVGSAAVGVAISVTTIPAAAYIGVAVALGGVEDARGAVVVLAVNVVCMQIAAAVTLFIQRLINR